MELSIFKALIDRAGHRGDFVPALIGEPGSVTGCRCQGAKPHLPGLLVRVGADHRRGVHQPLRWCRSPCPRFSVPECQGPGRYRRTAPLTNRPPVWTPGIRRATAVWSKELRPTR